MDMWFCPYMYLNHLALKPASLRCLMCIRAQLDYVHLYPLRALLRLLRSNPISSNPSLPPPLPPAPSLPTYGHAVIHTNTHTHAAQILLLVIHVVGLLLSLLWIYTHKTPWTLLPQEHSQWYLGKDSVLPWRERARIDSKWVFEKVAEAQRRVAWICLHNKSKCCSSLIISLM